MEEMDKNKISDTCILLDSLKGEISSIKNSTVDMGELLDNIWKCFTTLKDEIATSSEAQNTVLQEKLFMIFESLNSFKNLLTTMNIETGRVQDQMTFISDSYQQDNENSTTLDSETDPIHSDSQSDNEDEGKNFSVDIKIKTENEFDASDYFVDQNLHSDESTTLVEGKDTICVTSGKKIVSANSYTCVVCEEKFTNWQALNTHLDEMHIRSGSAQGNTESLSDVKLNEIGDIRTHSETGTAVMEDLTARKIDHRSGRIKTRGAKRDVKHGNTTAANPDSNLDPYGEKWPKDCGYCGQTFQEKKNYDRHTRAANSRCVRKFNCRYCSQTFINRKGYREHIRYRHMKLRQVECDICGRTISGKFALKRHKLVHSGVKNFACDQCDGRFTCKRMLERHVLSVHENRRDHVCEICAKAYNTMSNLNAHMKSHNLEGIEYKCEECGRVCTTAAHLKKHMMRHQVSRRILRPPYGPHCMCVVEPQVPCDFCDLKFYEKGELTVHRRVHTGETPFECQKCGKKFMNSSARRRHVNVCGVEPTIACKFCGKKYHDKYTTKKHMMKWCAMKPSDEREREKIMEELEANDSSFSLEQKYCGDVEPYRCSKCGKLFRQGKTFGRHEAVCGVEANFACEMCGKKFVELWRLQKHEVHAHINGSRQPRKPKISVPKKKKEKQPPVPRKERWPRKYSRENLLKAVEDVKNKKLKLAEASDKYGIPKTTIFDRVKAVIGKNSSNKVDAGAELNELSGDSGHNGGDDCQEIDSTEKDGSDMEGAMSMELDNDFKDAMNVEFHTSDLGTC